MKGFAMNKLTNDYRENVAALDSILSVKENFDILKKTLIIGEDELTLYFIDGFVKDAVMQKMMVHFLSLKSLGERTDRSAQDFLFHNVPYVEADVTDDIDTMVQMMLSGATVMLGSAFLNRGIIVDARTYPARDTAEPENDRYKGRARRFCGNSYLQYRAHSSQNTRSASQDVLYDGRHTVQNRRCCMLYR